MIGGKKKQQTRGNRVSGIIEKPVNTIDTLVGSGTVLKGDLQFTGGIRIDGHIKGTIVAMDSDKGALVLSESGVIEGDVNVPHVVINGKVFGNIISSSRVELQSKANITGDIHYKAVEMELGSVLNGSLVSEPGKPKSGIANANNNSQKIEQTKTPVQGTFGSKPK